MLRRVLRRLRGALREQIILFAGLFAGFTRLRVFRPRVYSSIGLFLRGFSVLLIFLICVEELVRVEHLVQAASFASEQEHHRKK